MQTFITNNIYIDVWASIIPYISQETVSRLKPRIVSWESKDCFDLHTNTPYDIVTKVIYILYCEFHSPGMPSSISIALVSLQWKYIYLICMLSIYKIKYIYQNKREYIELQI
jgi:hypothetical protein